MSPSRRSPSAFTLIENLFAMAIVGLCFIALYSLSSQALYVVNSGRDAVAAKQSLNDRLEQIRGCTWAQITSASYLQNLVLNTSTNGENRLANPVESLAVNSYPTPFGAPIVIVRQNGKAVTTSTNTAIASGDVVRVDLSLTWTATAGLRVRSQSRSTLVARSAP